MRIIYLILCCLLLAGCTTKDKYSFIVAGHIYGNSAIEFTPGVHPPFKNKFNSINSLPNLEFAVFAGDMVQKSIPEQWDAVDKDLELLNVKKHFVAGNHDIANRPLYEKRYGPTRYSFIHKNDLFIVLDSNIDNWNIKGDQLEWFETLLAKEAKTAKHIFIFTHHLVWTPGDKRFEHVVTNWPPTVPDTTNFWSEIHPILKKYPNQIYWISGDLGANHLASSYAQYERKNLHFVATGMGYGKKDNVLFIEVNDQDVQVGFYSLKNDGKPIIE